VWALFFDWFGARFVVLILSACNDLVLVIKSNEKKVRVQDGNAGFVRYRQSM
jgi:hypothetical protein